MIWTRLQQKIFFLVVSLFTLVFVLTIYSIYSAALNQATRGYDTQLTVGRNVFLSQLNNEREHLASSVETISRDWALRRAVGQDTNDLESLSSILFNHSRRIEADISSIFDTELNLLASFGAIVPLEKTQAHLNGGPLDHTWIGLIDNKPYLLAAESINAPAPIGWLVMGQALDMSFLDRLKQLISLEINLIAVNEQDFQLALSTSKHPDAIKMSLQQVDFSLNDTREKTNLVKLESENVAVLAFEVFTQDNLQFIVVLHQSLSNTMAPVYQFLVELIPYFIVGLIFAIVGSFLISRSITQPVADLLKAARHISSGHYNAPINISERSELGLLAKEFSHMQQAVMERENKIKDQASEIEQTNRLKYENEIARKEKEIAQSATQAKSQFLANICHEIRTPLTSVIGYADMLNDSTINQNEKYRAINTISKSGHHMLGIVNDVLDVSKIEANKIELEFIEQPIQTIVSEVSSLIEVSARQKHLEFKIHYHYPLPSHLVCDPMRIKQILLNLCNNAVKFTSEGSVDLHIHFDEKRQRLIYVVADTGPGMSESQLNRLFTAFAQADESTSRKYGGTGLGLYISQQLAEMLGGHIKVTSEPEVGSQFAVYLPWRAPASYVMIENESEAYSSVSMHHAIPLAPPWLSGNLLCADDNEDNRRLLIYLLRKTGLDVTIVKNGKQAVEAAMTQPFDLIFMDMQMPIMDGLEATRLLKKQAPDIPIVMLTANVDAQSQKKMVLAGIDEHLGKPIDKVKFYELLERYFPARREVKLNKEAVKAKHQAESNRFDALIQDYHRRLPEKAQEIQTALHQEQWNILQTLTHKLKGSAGSFGFPEISEVASQVEYYLEQKKYGKATEITILLIDQLNEVELAV